MKIALASLLISQLAFAQAAASPGAPPPPPTAQAPSADAPLAVTPSVTPNAAASSAPVAGLKQADPYRVMSPIVMFTLAGASVAMLIFAVVMDVVSTSTRNHVATMENQQDVLSAQGAAVSQANAANAGYAIGAVLALATAVAGRLTYWKD